MGLTLDLPLDLAAALQTEADERGLTLSQYAVEVLSRSCIDASDVKTGAGLVRYWEQEGLLGMRADIDDASGHARRLREQAQHRS